MGLKRRGTGWLGGNGWVCGNWRNDRRLHVGKERFCLRCDVTQPLLGGLWPVQLVAPYMSLPILSSRGLRFFCHVALRPPLSHPSISHHLQPYRRAFLPFTPSRFTPPSVISMCGHSFYNPPSHTSFSHIAVRSCLSHPLVSHLHHLYRCASASFTPSHLAICRSRLCISTLFTLFSFHTFVCCDVTARPPLSHPPISHLES